MIAKHIDFIQGLVHSGGPQIQHYEEINHWLAQLRNDLNAGIITSEDLDQLRETMGEALSIKTTQRFAYRKPHGYAWDFEIIDKLYQYEISQVQSLASWDRYVHAQASPKSVRKRKLYFQNLLKELEITRRNAVSLTVLNIGSGPGRDIAEYLDAHPESRIKITCLDQNANAIDYAKNLCRAHGDKIIFQRGNAFQFKSDETFDLIWSGGLFDYLDDRRFVFLLKHFMAFLKPGGKLIIGNFSIKNTSGDYMELILDWHLYHRTIDDLYRLALQAGCAERDYYVIEDPTHAVLYLHIYPKP